MPRSLGQRGLLRPGFSRIALMATLALAVSLPAAAAGANPAARAPGPSPAEVALPSISEVPRLSAAWSGLEVRDLDGRVWRPADLEGRVVLLEFWATWCAPCLADFPRLKRVTELYGDSGLVVLAVSLDRGARRELWSFSRRQGVTWPIVFDGRGVAGPVARRFQVQFPPRSLLFDRQGRLVALDARGESLEAALRVLFAAENPQ